MAITTFRAERYKLTEGASRYVYDIYLDGHSIGAFVRKFEVLADMGEAPIVRLEVIANALIVDKFEGK